MNTPSPVLIPQHAVSRLPRLALVLLCLLYTFAGLFGHEPWKRLDVTSFGYMWSLAQNQSTIFNLQLAGLNPEIEAYLPYWLGATSIQLLSSWVTPEIAARLPFTLLSLVSMVFIWNGIYYLARNPQAQPVAFAFGGEAQPKDYARSLADAGLLAYVACLGLALPSHETTPMAMQLHCISAVFAGAALLPFFPKRALIIFCSGLLMMAISGAPSIALVIGFGCVFLWFKNPQSQKHQIILMLLTIGLMLAVVSSLDLWRWRISPVSEISTQWRQKGELLTWFLWPAWPLAAWTLWRWRAHWSLHIWSQHLILPLFIFVTTLLASLLTRDTDRTLLLALPSIAALAAFALPTLSRSVGALIDWFTMLFFTGGAIIIWGVWLSLQTGIPAQPALNVERLVPGFVHSFHQVSVLLAVTVTAVWFKLIHWRVGRHPSAIWKSLVLPASGATLCWVLLMTLWLPILDQALSYRPWAQILTAAMNKPSCVYAVELERNQIAGLSYHGQFEFKPFPIQTNTYECDWLMIKSSAMTNVNTQNQLSEWSSVFKSKRPADKNEEILVLKSKRTRANE